ncbi:hypothetical protein D3C71_1212880 [compost metagenome]
MHALASNALRATMARRIEGFSDVQAVLRPARSRAGRSRTPHLGGNDLFGRRFRQASGLRHRPHLAQRRVPGRDHGPRRPGRPGRAAHQRPEDPQGQPASREEKHRAVHLDFAGPADVQCGQEDGRLRPAVRHRRMVRGERRRQPGGTADLLRHPRCHPARQDRGPPELQPARHAQGR